MWKREKIGSTSRVGPDNIMPFLKYESESLKKIIYSLKRSGENGMHAPIHLKMSCLIDKSFKLVPISDLGYMK